MKVHEVSESQATRRAQPQKGRKTEVIPQQCRERTTGSHQSGTGGRGTIPPSTLKDLPQRIIPHL